jgi:hypothetical protein
VSKAVRRGDVKVGPNLNPRRGSRHKPIGAAVLLAFLAVDVDKWHLVHHLAGMTGDWIVFVIAIIWGVVRVATRRSR